ncbi:MAG: YbaB/EbfC family nucleoid-associated protein [Planctomycetota bacterium]|nr:YbaB/EbfC family nucleoid-associated protein [Planctomycetota bacterium]
MSGPLGDMTNLLAQAQKMQRAMGEAKEALANERVSGTAGGGAVTVEFDGSGQVLGVQVSKEAYGSGLEDLQELLLLAIKDGQAKAERLREQRMGDVTGGLNLPGLL